MWCTQMNKPIILDLDLVIFSNPQHIYIISDKTSMHLPCSGLSLHSTLFWDIKELYKQIDQVIMA